VDRVLVTAVALLVAILLLPAVAHLAQDAVPALVVAVVLLGVVRLALPWHRRR
jgi:hypothetical protein